MISLSKAKKALESAEDKARSLGIAVSIAIVDDHGTLLAFSRMDGAIKISPRFAFEKAYTAGSLGMPTAGIAGYAIEGKPYSGLNSIFGGELTTIAGGVPVMIDGKLAGGVGVGGSTDVSQDAICAEEAAKILSQ